MATVRKTITLTDQQDDWIKAQVDAGDYTNDSEYIRDLIRREQERGAEIEVIRSALIEGEKSGKPKRFDANAFKRKLHTDLLTAAFQVLAGSPKSAPTCDHIREGYRRRSVERHMIYFRITDYCIAIVRVLHERMDAPHHL
jgi:antitoxin ParD1/3/4